MTTTTKTATNNFKVDTAMNTTVDTEAELIKHNGLSFEGFLATNAGLTIEEYRARKAANEAAEQAEAERRTKIFNLKDGIKSAEYTITETSGTLDDIIKNHYRPETDDGSWDEYTAELGDTLATAVSTLNTLKAQLAELEPATDTTTAEADEPKEFTANCYYTYTKDDGEWNGSQSKKFATATEAANWIINLVRENGYTLTEPTNIRDWENHKRYYANEADFNAANTTTDTAEVKDTTAPAKVDRLAELKRKHKRAVDESLRLGKYLFCSEDRTAYKAHAPRGKRIVDAEIKYSCLQYKIGKYAEEIDAREKKAVRAHEHREGVPNIEGDNLHDSAKIVSATPEASTKIKKTFSRRKNHERKKTARHTQHRPRRMVHAARRH